MVSEWTVSARGKKLWPAAAAEGKLYFPDLPSFHRDTAVLAVKSMSWPVGQASTLEERSRGAKFSLRGKSSSSVRTLRKLLLLLCLPRGGTGTAATHSSLAAGAEYAKAGHQLGEDCWEGTS